MEAMTLAFKDIKVISATPFSRSEKTRKLIKKPYVILETKNKRLIVRDHKIMYDIIHVWDRALKYREYASLWDAGLPMKGIVSEYFNDKEKAVVVYTKHCLPIDTTSYLTTAEIVKVEDHPALPVKGIVDARPIVEGLGTIARTWVDRHAVYYEIPAHENGRVFISLHSAPNFHVKISGKIKIGEGLYVQVCKPILIKGLITMIEDAKLHDVFATVMLATNYSARRGANGKVTGVRCTQKMLPKERDALEIAWGKQFFQFTDYNEKRKTGEQ